MAKELSATRGRYAVAIGVMLVIAAAHAFRLGKYLSGSWFRYYYSFFSDIVLPFGVYFLLCLNDARVPLLRSWAVKCALVFGIAAAAEVCQAFGIPMLGTTFDPLDFVMYAVGVTTAAVIERQLLSRFFGFWTLKESK